MKKIRTIQIGVGTRGAGHLKTVMESEMFEPVALVDVVEKYFDHAVEAYNFPREHCYKTLEDALEKVDADAAIISSPSLIHAQHIEASLKADLHVWVEKPLTCDLASARSNVALAGQRGKKLMVGNQLRYSPAVRTLIRLIAEEFAGKPGYATFVQHKVRPTPYHPGTHEQLWEMCVHNFDSIRAVLKQKPVSVFAHSYVPPWSKYLKSAVVSAEIAFEDGLTLNFLSSSDSKAKSYEFRVECGEGALIQTDQSAGPGIRHLKPDAQTPWVTVEDLVPLDEQPNQSTSTWQLMMFYDYLVKDIEPENSGRNNLPTIELCDAVQRSSETGEVIRDFSSEPTTME